MPNSTSDEIKMLNDSYEDGMFRLVMKDVAEKEGKILYNENEMLKKDPEYMPSQESIKRFSKMLDSNLKKAKRKHNTLRFSKIINRAAVVALAIIFLLSTAMVTVQAFRIQALNFLINIESKYTSYQLSANRQNDPSKGGLTINWANAYEPTYIPKDYQVTSVSSSEALKKVIFTNKKDTSLTVIYCEYNSSNSIAVDTENATLVKKIKINGADSTLSVKDNIVSVAWIIDEHLFTIQGRLSTDEAVKLAQSVKFNK